MNLVIRLFILKLSVLAENEVAISSSDLSHYLLVYVTATAEKRVMVVSRNQ